MKKNGIDLKEWYVNGEIKYYENFYKGNILNYTIQYDKEISKYKKYYYNNNNNNNINKIEIYCNNKLVEYILYEYNKLNNIIVKKIIITLY